MSLVSKYIVGVLDGLKECEISRPEIMFQSGPVALLPITLFMPWIPSLMFVCILHPQIVWNVSMVKIKGGTFQCLWSSWHFLFFFFYMGNNKYKMGKYTILSLSQNTSYLQFKVCVLWIQSNANLWCSDPLLVINILVGHTHSQVRVHVCSIDFHSACGRHTSSN